MSEQLWLSRDDAATLGGWWSGGRPIMPLMDEALGWAEDDDEVASEFLLSFVRAYVGLLGCTDRENIAHAVSKVLDIDRAGEPEGCFGRTWDLIESAKAWPSACTPKDPSP